jgi:hypothetical protein
MNEQENVDQWLRDAMNGSTPRLSAAFDARLEKRLRPRRLTPAGRMVRWLRMCWRRSSSRRGR